MLKYALSFCWAVMASSSWLSAQSITPTVISSGGGFKSTSAGSLSFTIGEAVVTTLSKTNSILTQGFQQGLMNGNTSIAHLDAGNVSIQLFPSPASSYLEFNIAASDASRVGIVIYDILGNKLYDVQNIQGSGSAYHAVQGTADLADAIYIARISVTDASGATQYFSRRFTINN